MTVEYEGWPYPAFVEDVDVDEGHKHALGKNVVNISSSSFFLLECTSDGIYVPCTCSHAR